MIKAVIKAAVHLHTNKICDTLTTGDTVIKTYKTAKVVILQYVMSSTWLLHYTHCQKSSTDWNPTTSPLNETIDVAQNGPLWRLMTAFDATHSRWCMLVMNEWMNVIQYAVIDIVIRWSRTYRLSWPTTACCCVLVPTYSIRTSVLRSLRSGLRCRQSRSCYRGQDSHVKTPAGTAVSRVWYRL